MILPTLSPGPVEASIREREVEMLALYALGVPTDLLVSHYGIAAGDIRRRASDAKVRRPLDADRKLLNRVARAERIKRHMAEYPAVSLFSNVAEAA